MKKILILLASLLVLVGCEAAPVEVKLSTQDEVLFEGPDITYTKEDLFEVLKLNAQYAIDKELVKLIAEDKGITFESFDQEAQEYVDLMASYGLEESMISYYGSVQAFKELYQNSLLETALVKDYVSDNYSKYVTEDRPKKIQLVNFENEEVANKFVEDVNGGMSFEQAATENKYESDCSAFIATANDDLVYEVKEYLFDTNELGISPVIKTTINDVDENGTQTETVNFYIVNIVESNADVFKDDYLGLKSQTISLNTIIDDLYKTYNVEFYDQGIYKQMITAHEVLK